MEIPDQIEEVDVKILEKIVYYWLNVLLFSVIEVNLGELNLIQ